LLLLPPGCRQAELLGRWRSADDPLCHPRPPLDGNQLQQQLGLGAGPRLGRLLIHLSQERAFARLPAKADRAQVLALARQWLEENGPAEPNATRRRD
jgi:tRNA nucleotidyltransferase (CCA-adding enzyme)